MSSRDSRRATAGAQTLEILYDMAQLLNTQLDKETLATCVSLIESGANPEALAMVVKELRNTNAELVASREAEARR